MSKPLRDVTLESKFTLTDDAVLINGNQALVRLLLLQQEMDAGNGLNTAGFVSGYRGSPLGGLDAALWSAGDRLDTHNIRFHPGVNEDLAATSITGTQQIETLPGAKFDGVFAMWYGKGPGVDRSVDALKHGNYSGAHRNGGVLVVYGDDHPGKSSTVGNQSEPVLASINMPSLYPASVAEFIEYGLLGWALSRYSGLWVGFKCVNETIEQTATCDIRIRDFQIATPDQGALPSGGVNYHPIAYDRAAEEALVCEARLPLVHRFVRANGIDRVTHGAGKGRLGIVTAGKAWQETISALQSLGITPGRARDIGLSVYKVGCIWPLEPTGLREFAAGHDELLFIEEKRGLVEEQAAQILINEASRPRLSGKRAPDGDALISLTGLLDPAEIAVAVAKRLRANGLHDTNFDAVLQPGETAEGAAPPAIRAPYFCSGCPHNTSTRLPEGSFGMAGIGCHVMAGWYRPDTLAPLQMGGEGANWIGLAPFTETGHVFQNLGDGTYYHSGLTAIRAACAAGVNITYKILFNDAVAMTGGQPVDGPISVGEISYQVIHEGVTRCVVVSDNPNQYGKQSGLAPGVDVFHRDELMRVQKDLRETPGCTVLIYEQTCAAEKRRRRKRGRMEDPAKRMFINAAVCEGCGDCSVQSTCVSLLPVETAFGRKRMIDQSSCNKDYSCNKGFCPSFVTIYGAEPRKPDAVTIDANAIRDLPEPVPMSAGYATYNIMIAGIGGTGVITVGAVLGMAAHLEHRACSIYDMTGLSQKNGAVYSHLKLADSNDALDAQRIGRGGTDLLLGFDLIAAQGAESFSTLAKDRTRVVGNSRVAPTARFQLDPDDRVDTRLIEQQFAGKVGRDNLHLVDATGIALSLCGDTIASNMFTVGFAFQSGLLPLQAASIERAIELNGRAVTFNKNAFLIGRLAAHDPAAIDALLAKHDPAPPAIPTSLQEIVEHRACHLADYQDEKYANRYRRLIDRVVKKEDAVAPGSTALSIAVATYYAKLLAYKDEYEVARLHSDPAFLESLRNQFDGDMRLEFNLAPPIISRRHPETGFVRKRAFGAWVLPLFRLLARGKRLRGSKLDIFGHTAERRLERQLIADYEQLIEDVVERLSADNIETAVMLAQLPEGIRGYGQVKLEHIERTRLRLAELREKFDEATDGEASGIQSDRCALTGPVTRLV
jgi:indolepyruvate ferredoxin oxidoreductase